MASENLELVRSIYPAWERGDFSSVDWAHPNIEFSFADDPLLGRWKGLAGLAEGWGTFLSAWEQFRVLPEEFRELDDERVFVLVSFAGRGKTSGLDAQTFRKGANLFHVQDGKVTQFFVYNEHKRALAELGLGGD